MNQTLRYSLIYGGLTAAVLAAFLTVTLTLSEQIHWVATQAFGYSVMLVAMSFVFVGVKRYRDVEGGGVVKFWHALGLGLLIALIGCLAYILIWEAYLAVTHYRFMDDYVAKMLQHARANGKSAAAIAKLTAEGDAMRAMYANPLTRMVLTLMEIGPVGLVVAFVSAALLCNPRVFPARG